MKSCDSLRFELLGTVRAWRDEEEVDLGEPKQRAVLALLLLHRGRMVTRDEIINAIWGDDPPARAANAVYRYIGGLRTALEPGRAARQVCQLLVYANGGYQLQLNRDQLDLELFRDQLDSARELRAAGELTQAMKNLDAALELWIGPPLNGLPGHYVPVERDRLTERRNVAVEERASVALHLGHPEEAVTDLLPLVSEYPFRESLQEILMQALYRCGRQAEALEAYRTVRQRLANELGIEPGPQLRALYLRILRNDPVLTRQPSRPAKQAARIMSLDAAAVAGWGVTTSLPEEVPELVGRDRELATLHDLLHTARGDEPGRIIVINSPGWSSGVGRTALALHFAHQVAPRFPDGRIWINLRGDDPHRPPMAVDDMLLAVLRGLGDEPDIEPSDVAALTRRYRSISAGRRILIVLDDAATEEQVRQLLPTEPGSLVLVTSRRRLFDLPGGFRIDHLPLAPLTQSDAVRMFGCGPRTSRADMAQLAELCDNLPLALRIVSGSLAANPHIRVSDPINGLAQERGQTGGKSAIAAALSWSYRQLPAQEARMFRLLGLHAGAEVATYAAAALADITPSKAQRILHFLTENHLVQAVGTNHFQMHDEIHRYAAIRASVEEPIQDRTEAITRAFTWYLHAGPPVNLILKPAESSTHDGRGNSPRL